MLSCLELVVVVLTGVQIGWGAECGKHNNSDDEPGIKCRAQLWYGKHHPMSDEKVIRGLKRWLVWGLTMQFTDPTKHRHEHLALRPRTCAREPTDDEEDLEDEVDILT